MRPAIDVAVGVIFSRSNILLALRQQHQEQAGLWEFPGGKVDQGESPRQALSRECQEELGIVIDSPRPLLQVCYDNLTYSVLLHVFVVDHFQGEPRGMEGQRVEWVSPSRLSEYDFPAANEAIVAAIRL